MQLKWGVNLCIDPKYWYISDNPEENIDPGARVAVELVIATSINPEKK